MDGGGERDTVVYIVENANGAFSLWRPFRVDIFIARVRVAGALQKQKQKICT